MLEVALVHDFRNMNTLSPGLEWRVSISEAKATKMLSVNVKRFLLCIWLVGEGVEVGWAVAHMRCSHSGWGWTTEREREWGRERGKERERVEEEGSIFKRESWYLIGWNESVAGEAMMKKWGREGKGCMITEGMLKVWLSFAQCTAVTKGWTWSATTPWWMVLFKQHRNINKGLKVSRQKQGPSRQDNVSPSLC